MQAKWSQVKSFGKFQKAKLLFHKMAKARYVRNGKFSFSSAKQSCCHVHQKCNVYLCVTWFTCGVNRVRECIVAKRQKLSDRCV